MSREYPLPIGPDEVVKKIIEIYPDQGYTVTIEDLSGKLYPTDYVVCGVEEVPGAPSAPKMVSLKIRPH